MRKKQILKNVLCLLLSLAMLGPVMAYAIDNVPDDPELKGLLKAEEMQAILDDYIEDKHLNPDNISIGYCYTPTGETWYYNENEWYYSASMYKVPLMMLFAEKEAAGELTQESKLKGITLATAEEYILVNSNNEWAHLMMAVLGTEPDCRRMEQKYSDLPMDAYDPDFYDYSYFSAKFMTDVMMTLYYNQERFPHIIDCLKRAQTDSYFHRRLGENYPIAQKYGSYTDYSNRLFNHTSGIIFSDNPFILTVMTLNMGVSDAIIGDLAQAYEEYTHTLDTRLEQRKAELAEAERQAEETRLQAEAAAQQPEETPAADEEKAPDIQNGEPGRVDTAAMERTEEAAQPQRSGTTRLLVIGTSALVLVLLLIMTLSRSRKRQRVGAGRR